MWKRFLQHWRAIGIVALVVILIAGFSFTHIISGLIGYKLRDIVEAHFHAQLQYDSLSYEFPRTVSVKNLRFVTDADRGGAELVKIERVTLTLAHIPSRGNPVVIQAMELRNPSVRVVRTPEGLVGGQLARKQEEVAQRPRQKLSDIFELRRLTVSDGEVTYEDRRFPDAAPLVIRGITTDTGVTPQSRSVYGYQFKGGDAHGGVKMDASGTFDIDELILSIAKLAMEVKASQAESAPGLAKLVNDLKIAGVANLTGSAQFPLRALGGSTFSGSMSLAGGHADVNFAGDPTGGFKPTAAWSLQLQLHSMTIWPQHFPKPIQNIDADLHMNAGTVELTQLTCDCLNGQATAQGTLVLQAPQNYHVQVQAQQVDLEQLASWDLLPHKKPINLSGKSHFHVTGDGMISNDHAAMLSALKGSGYVEVTGGEIWSLPVMDGILSQMTTVKREALTVSQVAAVFSIANRTVTLKHAAVSSDILGLQGKGTVGFDGMMDLDVIAAPLGDWRQQVKKANIPLVGNFAGNVAHGIQKMVGSATSNLLYEFQVTGLVGQPQIKTIPSPMLNDASAMLFGKMMQELKDHQLLDSVRTEE